MLYKFIYFFHVDFSWLNVFRYITFRTIIAALSSLALFFILGKYAINRLNNLQVGEFIRDEGPANHKEKEGTPTMGGCLLLPIIIVSVFMWAEVINLYIGLAIFVVIGFGAVGFMDDYLKVIRKNSAGLSVKMKFFLQVLVALIVAFTLYFYPGFDVNLNVPFLKDVTPEMGVWFIPFTVLVIVGSSNAVNLTDGLDGLAIGPIVIAFISYLIFAYIAGHAKISQYLQVPYIAGSGELSVLCGATVGAGLGFLWYNAYPAEVFMGDVGSLPLGALLGTIAVITKQELVLLLVGGLFVFEAFSVIIQVAYFKITGGQRIFRMAPVHHHFELKGWHESKVTVRFWIIAIILALLSIGTLKLR
ncbi:MAG: phospho-N-acetylmuramoyl-pentapeptide-transferase [Deltaproteobacteria bacterium]|nr:phospho-N-acetylmuramoyl-pentapeptide-transferase [Deltaproteobacteria bacterium]